MTKKLVIAVDFDGTLCYSKYPNLGDANIDLINELNMMRRLGHKLILWTCREGDALTEAVDFCTKHGLKFDAINENIPELIDDWGTDPRKIGADLYVDDLSIHPRDLLESKFCHTWDLGL